MVLFRWLRPDSRPAKKSLGRKTRRTFGLAGAKRQVQALTCPRRPRLPLNSTLEEKIMQTKTTVIIGNSRRMKEVKGENVHLVVAFPPYWQLSD